MKPISKLQLITTSAAVADAACGGGASWVQLRLKDTPYPEFRNIAIEVQQVCRRHGATFIINDNVQLAMELVADGVHLGKNDMPAEEARALLGPDFIIGCTANTYEDVVRLSKLPTDYIGLGPFRFTGTKKNLSPVIGLEGYQRIIEALSNNEIPHPPLVGVGGITNKDVSDLIDAGLYGVAVSGAICNAADVTTATTTFKQLLQQRVV